jgi:hypothetical protein
MTQETQTSSVRQPFRRTRNAGINLSFETLKILDELRGDVPKSTFTLRLIERAFREREESDKGACYQQTPDVTIRTYDSRYQQQQNPVIDEPGPGVEPS